jgi:nitrogen fixation protein FixH
MAAQKELGWDGALLLPESIVAGERSSYGLRVIDRVGSAVVADSVEIYLFRPSDVSADFSSRMDPSGDGNYLADLIFPLPGVWDVVVSINRGGDQFEITERIFVSKNRGL